MSADKALDQIYTIGAVYRLPLKIFRDGDETNEAIS